MPEVKPDRETLCQRFQLIRLGDGNDYRCLIMPSVGAKCDEMMDSLEAQTNASNRKERSAANEAFVRAALGTFYQDSTIKAISDAGFIGAAEITLMIDAVMSEFPKPDEQSSEPIEIKKNASDAT